MRGFIFFGNGKKFHVQGKGISKLVCLTQQTPTMIRIFLALAIITLGFTSCEKEELAPKLKRETAEKLLGKWTVQRTVEEVYDPLHTLSNTTIIAGTASDYFHFKTSELVEIASSPSSIKVQNYTVWNPSQVMIAEVGWWIEKLTATELELKLDINDAARYKRYVTKIYMVRSR